MALAYQGSEADCAHDVRFVAAVKRTRITAGPVSPWGMAVETRCGWRVTVGRHRNIRDALQSLTTGHSRIGHRWCKKCRPMKKGQRR